MYRRNGCFEWKILKRCLPLEVQVGLRVGSVAAISLLRSLVTCLQKFEEHEDIAVFRFSDEKVSRTNENEENEKEDNEEDDHEDNGSERNQEENEIDYAAIYKNMINVDEVD